ncbi:MAG: threonine synthase, partial [Clostridia bacterium]|nr:threonine synthase [Clostridia bacterium]
VPLVVYYVSAYLDAVKKGFIEMGEVTDVAVPTGNFGNILAAYIAKKMGLPVGKLICASNENNVLTDFIETGVYDKNRPFHTTSSPSMDILISSNVERLLWFLSGHDSAFVAEKMKELSADGRYELPEDMKTALKACFKGGWASEDAVFGAIAKNEKENGYLADTHTSVALAMLDDMRKAEGEAKKTIVASTASPFKFAASVLEALDGEKRVSSPALSDELAEKSGVPVPEPLKDLDKRPVRFPGVVKKEDMREPIKKMLGI